MKTEGFLLTITLLVAAYDDCDDIEPNVYKEFTCRFDFSLLKDWKTSIVYFAMIDKKDLSSGKSMNGQIYQYWVSFTDNNMVVFSN